MPSILDKHRQTRAERGPLAHVTTADRLAVLEEAVAEATGATVAELRDRAQQRADGRTGTPDRRR